MCNLPNKDSWALNEVIWANFENSVLYSVANRDKVGNFGRFDDQTFPRNGWNLHTKRAFTHDTFRWNHNIRPAVSLSAIQCATNSVFSALACKMLKFDGKNSGFWSVTPPSWSACCRHRSTETGNVVNYHLTGGGQEVFDLLEVTSPGRA